MEQHLPLSRVCQHAQLTFQSITTQESIVGFVHAKELMILCNDLCSAAIVKNEVFYVIQKIFWLTKTGNKKLQTDTVLSDSFSVQVLLFILNLQLFKEKLIPCSKVSEASFHTIRQNTNLVVVEQIPYILQIILQINVIGFLHRDIAVSSSIKTSGNPLIKIIRSVLRQCFSPMIHI